MLPSYQRSIQCVGTLLVMLSLGACGGLPKGGERPPSTAMKNNGGTALAAAVQPRVAAHPGQSGLHALPDGRDALAARLALADAAQRSLDVQYYIWNKDMAGKVLLEHLFRAADRGVRVRLLLDDLGTMPSDAVLLAIDSHPNIEVRMFNPVALRSPRLLGMVADFGRINKRMHNKSFIADGQVAIVGGRNIGDEYFEAHAAMNFADLDVAVIGPVVKEVSDEFDLYWNHQSAIPIAALARQNTTPEQFAEKRAALIAYHETAADSDYAESVRDSEFARQLRNRNVPTLGTGHDRERPSRQGAHLRREDRDASRPAVSRGRRSNEARAVPRLALLRAGEAGRRAAGGRAPARRPGCRDHQFAGIHRRCAGPLQIPALPQTADPGRRRTLRDQADRRRPAQAALSRTGRIEHGGLHAKTFTFDRRIGFIGSYNLDPRSSKLNTEMGVLFNCPALARRLPEKTERDLGRNAYRVELEGNHLVWVTREGDKQVRYNSEPEAGLWKRIKVQMISWLPIECLL